MIKPTKRCQIGSFLDETPDGEGRVLISPIQAGPIVLREFSFSGKEATQDKDAIEAIARHPEFKFYAFDPDDITGSVDCFFARLQRLQFIDNLTNRRESYKLAICLPEDLSVAIGYVALDEVSQAYREVRDVGTFVHPAHQKQGYGRWAKCGLLEPFFRANPEEEVWATVHPENTKSLQGVLGLGFQRCGRTTKVVNGVIEPRLVLAVNASTLILPQRKNAVQYPAYLSTAELSN